MASLAELVHLERMGVRVHVVPAATHTSAYLLAGTTFYVAVDEMSNLREGASRQ